MIQTQSQNEEIRQIRSKVADEVWDNLADKVRCFVAGEVIVKVEVGFKAKNNVRKWLFL